MQNLHLDPQPSVFFYYYHLLIHSCVMILSWTTTWWLALPITFMLLQYYSRFQTPVSRLMLTPNRQLFRISNNGEVEELTHLKCIIMTWPLIAIQYQHESTHVIYLTRDMFTEEKWKALQRFVTFSWQ